MLRNMLHRQRQRQKLTRHNESKTTDLILLILPQERRAVPFRKLRNKHVFDNGKFQNNIFVMEDQSHKTSWTSKHHDVTINQ